jgi:hypothetical protein
MNYAHLKKPQLDYRYEFAVDELDAAYRCNEEHGFVVIKHVLPDDRVKELQESVRRVTNPLNDLEPGKSRTHTSYIEEAPESWKLLEYEPFMAIHRRFLNSDELTVHRTAAIIRNPGSAALVWHSDWRGFSDAPPQGASDVLNRGPGPSGMWFYLTGSYPQHGGLAVIEDSHTPEWAGPEGFEFTPDRVSFYPRGSEPKGYTGFDIPGLVPLFTDPNDMIIFAARTYHGAFPNQIDQVRLSCAIGFRSRHEHIAAPWPLSTSAQAFVQALPPHVQPLVEEYTGIDPKWSAGGMM